MHTTTGIVWGTQASTERHITLPGSTPNRLACHSNQRCACNAHVPHQYWSLLVVRNTVALARSPSSCCCNKPHGGQMPHTLWTVPGRRMSTRQQPTERGAANHGSQQQQPTKPHVGPQKASQTSTKVGQQSPGCAAAPHRQHSKVAYEHGTYTK